MLRPRSSHDARYAGAARTRRQATLSTCIAGQDVVGKSVNYPFLIVIIIRTVKTLFKYPHGISRRESQGGNLLEDNV